ncbi:MAG: hypothetical protein HC830_00690 [Bacteroidetes bacterium]|nr:hypothetical protein [Bacteroidota bacterium]
MKNLFSFIIPVRIDNEERYQNLQCSVSYIRKHFPLSEVIVVENASKPYIREYLNQLPDVSMFLLKMTGNSQKQKL